MKLILFLFLCCLTVVSNDLQSIEPLDGMEICCANYNPKTNSVPKYANDLYPIGFSPKSHFAYLECIRTDALMYWRFNVVNLITDKIEHFIIWDNDEELQENCKTDLCSFKELILLKQSKIYTLLERYSITVNSNLVVKNPPAVIANNGYNITLTSDVPAKTHGDDYDPTELSKHSVFVSKKGAGRKMVGTLMVAERKKCKILGFMRSPFEQRTVVLIQYFKIGFEGTGEHHFKLFGCNLKRGFK